MMKTNRNVLRFVSSNRMKDFAMEWFNKYEGDKTKKEERKFVGIGEVLVPDEMVKERKKERKKEDW